MDNANFIKKINVLYSDTDTGLGPDKAIKPMNVLILMLLSERHYCVRICLSVTVQLMLLWPEERV